MENFINHVEKNGFDLAVILIITVGLYIFGSTVVSWVTSLLIKRVYNRTLQPKDLEKRQKTLSGLVVNLWKVIVCAVAIFSVVKLFVDPSILTPLFASAGIIGVALGFGAQSLVKDFLSGIFIISENQYRVGDVIEIDGFSGTVEKIGARSTVLRDVEGNVHYFPNGIIQHVINKTMDYSVARVVISVDPDTNIDKAAEIINDIGTKMSEEEKWKARILTPPAYVMLGDISATSVGMIVSGKVPPSDQWAVSAELKQRILNEFEKAGIELGTVMPTISGLPKRKH